MTAARRTRGEGSIAPPATSDGTEERIAAGRPWPAPMRVGLSDIPLHDEPSSTDTSNELASESLTSRPSGTPSRPSTRRFRQPRNVREFAAQANIVATRILNSEIDLDTARAYSAVARTVAQAMTTEVVRSRFLRSQPDLEFPDMGEED